MFETYGDIALYTIVGVAVFYFAVVLYNRMVSYKQSVESAKSSILVELKKRADLMPQVINSVKAFVKHENEMLTKLTALRSAILETNEEQKELLMQYDSDFFKTLFAVSEAYPDLRSSDSFIAMQETLERTEINIAAARHIYNSNVDNYNSLVGSFPAIFVALLTGHNALKYLEYNESELQKPVEVPEKF